MQRPAKARATQCWDCCPGLSLSWQDALCLGLRMLALNREHLTSGDAQAFTSGGSTLVLHHVVNHVFKTTPWLPVACATSEFLSSEQWLNTLRLHLLPPLLPWQSRVVRGPDAPECLFPPSSSLTQRPGVNQPSFWYCLLCKLASMFENSALPVFFPPPSTPRADPASPMLPPLYASHCLFVRLRCDLLEDHSCPTRLEVSVACTE